MDPYSLKKLRNISHCECLVYGSRCEYYAQYGIVIYWKVFWESLDSFKCQYCNHVGLEFIECDMLPKCVLGIHDIALGNQNLKMHKIIFGLFLV